MAHTVASAPVRCQGNSLAPSDDHEDKELVLLRQDFREAIEESGVKKEAVAAALGLSGPEYLSKLFSGEKSITARHIVRLPNHIEQIFERKRAERRGLVVVDRVDDATAARQLASGLFNLLIPKPVPAKADLPLTMAKASAR